MDTNEYNRRRCQSDAWVPAMVLVAVGGIFLLNNLHILRFREILQYWPVILIAAGLYMLYDRARGASGGER